MKLSEQSVPIFALLFLFCTGSVTAQPVGTLTEACWELDALVMRSLDLPGARERFESRVESEFISDDFRGVFVHPFPEGVNKMAFILCAAEHYGKKPDGIMGIVDGRIVMVVFSEGLFLWASFTAEEAVSFHSDNPDFSNVRMKFIAPTRLRHL